MITLGLIGLTAFAVTGAFFSDEETSSGNLFQAGAIDLEIDNTCYYNGNACIEGFWDGENKDGNECSCTWRSKSLDGELFFDLHDLKPGDWEEDTISFSVANPAWLCGDFKVTANNDLSCTEPEMLDENGLCQDPGENLGELGQNLNFVFWIDDGDNVFETEEEVLTRGNALSVFGGQEKWLKGDSGGSFGPIGPEKFYIAKYFCYGDIGETPLQQGDGTPDDRGSGFTCDGSGLDNQSQTDNFMVDLTFFAEQARHNDRFLCNPPEITVTPTPVACIPGYATGVVSSAQGLRKDGTAVLADRDDPNDALGAPESTGAPSDSPVIADTFFSLGFGAENIGGGNIVLSFANPIVDMAGFDFRVFEVTGGVYPDEKIKVEASQNGVNFFVVSASTARDSFLDLSTSGLPWAAYLRITDESDKSLFEATADAYDLDGVQTFCGTELPGT